MLDAEARTAYWRRWGPYLSERQWGTVREDYSPGGTAWDYFPHDHARSRAYRWGEDGLGGISDNHQRLCFALALWNGRDPILKERLFGLTGPQGNHGEDVKEYYFFLDSTPTHSYMKFLYKYPQAAFPYERLVEENGRRGRSEPEFELLDTGVFDEARYFDVTVEYAKAGIDDVLVRITVANRGPAAAALHVLPTLWFRNTWDWDAGAPRPRLSALPGTAGGAAIAAEHPTLGRYRLVAEGAPDLLFVENETNVPRIFGGPASTRFPKDGINDFVVHGRADAVNPARVGTKAAAHYRLTLGPGESVTLRLRLSDAAAASGPGPFGRDFESTMAARLHEADEFYDLVIPRTLSAEARSVMRQALGGMLWSKQFYHYDIKRWLAGDPTQPPPPPERRTGRNSEWTHLFNEDVISMPDTWEYPWYAAWDLAFHTIALALVDPEFAKSQLILLMREWYLHPNGQIPAYEWALGDVNPPVHAWAAWRVYQIERRIRGVADREFLQKIFHKSLLNFTWWVNRKDLRRKERLPGRLPGPRQHRRLRPLGAPADRRPHRAVGRHQLDGHVLPDHAGDRARARARGPGLRGHRQQVPRALRVHRPGHRPRGRREREPLGRGGRLLLRRPGAARRPAAPDEGAVAGGPDPALRRRDVGYGPDRPSAELHPPGALVHREQPRVPGARRRQRQVPAAGGAS